MKLIDYKNMGSYKFLFVFANGEQIETDIQDLVGKYVLPTEVSTAQINREWGCIEFKNGDVDIEPQTLYKFCTKNKASIRK